MTKTVLSVKPFDPVERARTIMAERRVNQLPVLRDGQLVGIVTDRDLRDAFPSLLDVLSDETKSPIAPQNVRVTDVMTHDVLTVEPDASIAEAARMLRRERIGAAPVVDGGKVVGILTRSDCLEALAAADSGTESPRRSQARRAQ